MAIIRSRNKKPGSHKIGGSLGVSSYSLDEQSDIPILHQNSQEKVSFGYEPNNLSTKKVTPKKDDVTVFDKELSGIKKVVPSDHIDVPQDKLLDASNKVDIDFEESDDETAVRVNLEESSGTKDAAPSDHIDVPQDKLTDASNKVDIDFEEHDDISKQRREKDIIPKNTKVIRGVRDKIAFSKFSESQSDSSIGSIGVTLEAPYPRIAPLSSNLLNESSNITESIKGYAMAGTVVLAGISFTGSGAIKNALTTQLGKAISDGAAANRIINQFGFSFLKKDLTDLSTIDKVGDVKSRGAMDFSRRVFSKTTIGIKVLDSMVDGVKLYHTPHTKHFKAVVMDCNDLYAMGYGVNVYTASISVADVAYNVYQEEYTQAATQVMSTSAGFLLSHMMSFAGSNQPGTYYGLGGALIMGGVLIKNMYSLYEELYVNNVYGTNSMIAYRDGFKYLSEVPYLKDLYDFTSIAVKYDISINNAMRDIAVENLESFLAAKGSFGEKINEKGVYSSAIKENYALLNKVSEGKVTLEEANTLWKNYVTIELQDRFYDRCIEVENIYNDNKDVYRCYSEKSENMDHVVIGEDNTVEIYSIS